MKNPSRYLERYFMRHHKYIQRMKEEWHDLLDTGQKEKAAKLAARINRKIEKINNDYKMLVFDKLAKK